MSSIRKSAKNRECQIRIPGICNFNTETTVLAHLNGGGIGIKQPDLFGAYACSSCHDEIDRRTRKLTVSMARSVFFDGMVRTQKILLDEGFIFLKK